MIHRARNVIHSFVTAYEVTRINSIGQLHNLLFAHKSIGTDNLLHDRRRNKPVFAGNIFGLPDLKISPIRLIETFGRPWPHFKLS